MTRTPTTSIRVGQLPDGLGDFAGGWRLSRKITDRRAGRDGTAEGRLDLVPEGGGLRYEERVVLHLPGQKPMAGTRGYRWEGHPGIIAVFFDDGRPFHDFALGEARPRALHHCDPDRYEVTYDFSDWPVWTVTWEVTGPRKDYRMETLFVRERRRDG